MKTILLLYIVLVTASFASCTTNKTTHQATVKPKATVKPNQTQPTPSTMSNELVMDFSGPATIVYKTKENYNNKVPVILSDDKTRIVSYPSLKDIFYNGTLAYPTQLEQGYLLDNRGIGKNVAFLNITYEEYSILSEVPALQNMYAMIIEKDPLLQMCNCGNRYKYNNVVSDMNRLIRDKKLNKCQKIK